MLKRRIWDTFVHIYYSEIEIEDIPLRACIKMFISFGTWIKLPRN
jgi:hypothetical protein